MDTNWYLSNASSEDDKEFSGQIISGDEETEENDEDFVDDLSAFTKHEPLDALHGKQIIAREYKRQIRQMKEKIAVLEAQLNAKRREIALLKEIALAKDKEIADLKEKTLELQQNGQTTVTELPEQKKQRTKIDFVEQMKTLDEELKKTKENICQAKGNLLKKKAEVENIGNEPQLFNAEDYFDHHQPSWFDILSNNIGCLRIENYPVRAKGLDTNRTSGSSEKYVNTKITKSTEDQHCLPPLFTPVNRSATIQSYQNNPVAATTGDSQKRPVNTFRKAAAKGSAHGYLHQRPLPPCVPLARSPMPSTYPANVFVQSSSARSFPHVGELASFRFSKIRT